MLLAVLSVLLILHSSRSEDTLDVIDDADLRILYSGSWVSYTGLNDSMNWAGTVTDSNTSGATANLTFVGQFALHAVESLSDLSKQATPSASLALSPRSGPTTGVRSTSSMTAH